MKEDLLMKRWIAWILCMIMAVSLLPAAVAEETEPTETPETAAMTEELGEAAVNNENADDTLIASEDGALAPTGFDVPEDETGRESDLSMKTETSDEPMTFELKDGFTALLDNGVMTVTGEGYQVQVIEDYYSSRIIRETAKITDPKTHTYTFSGLKSGKTYYVRVRSCQVFEGMTYFGEWSNVLSCKVK